MVETRDYRAANGAPLFRWQWAIGRTVGTSGSRNEISRHFSWRVITTLSCSLSSSAARTPPTLPLLMFRNCFPFAACGEIYHTRAQSPSGSSASRIFTDDQSLNDFSFLPKKKRKKKKEKEKFKFEFRNLVRLISRTSYRVSPFFDNVSQRFLARGVFISRGKNVCSRNVSRSTYPFPLCHYLRKKKKKKKLVSFLLSPPLAR